jgi:osmotically-inducible protein OsmY
MKWTSGLVVAAAVALAVTSMVARHQSTSRIEPAAHAQLAGPQTPALSDVQIVRAIQDANLTVNQLYVRNVGGIVVLRGSADAAEAARAGEVVKSLGFARVANLIVPDAKFDDDNIRRDAERQLAQARQLDGCTLIVSCDKGVLRVSGTVHHELQKDAARSVLRSVRGAREVQVDLSKV